MIRVVKVNGLRTPEERGRVVYVGRRFAGWPDTEWGNHGRHDCPAGFRAYLKGLPPDQLNNMLTALWEACGHGAKAIGCWCLTWTAGSGPTPGCHAAVWAELLAAKYAPGVKPAAPVATMKCLSLWQPWASLLVAGLKTVETRSWPIRHRGGLLIHAAKTWNRELAELSETEPFFSALLASAATSDSWRSADLPFGAVVGRVDVVGCIGTDRVGRWEQDPMAPTKNYFHDNLGIMGPADGRPYLFVSDDERAFGDYSPGRFAFLCENPVRFETPVPFRGAQGLFDVPADLAAALFASPGAP